jgi:type II secretory pathway component PulF
MEHRMLTRYRLNKLAKRLAAGTPFVDALEQTPGLIDDDGVLAIRFATQSGTLSKALPGIIDESSIDRQEDRFGFERSFLYYACVSFTIFISFLFIGTFIAPTYTKLFQEIELTPHPALDWLNATNSLFFSVFTPAFFSLLAIAFATWWLRPFRFFRRRLASRLFRSVSELRCAQLLRLLSITTDAGRPLAGSMSTLARYHFDRAIREKLLFARNEIELGAEPWSSLAAANLLSQGEAASLANSTSSQTRSWLMKQLARVKEDKVRHRIAILLSLIHPAIILLLGFLVLWIALACFGSLTQMTKILTTY